MTEQTESSTLPPAPRPKVEPPEPPPGGPTVLEGIVRDGAYTGEPRDPRPEANPATDDELPAETVTPDDTDTQATQGKPDVTPQVESPA